MYLLDTNVVSELRKPKPHGAVLEWLRATDDGSLFLPAIVLGELQVGVALTRLQDAEKAAAIERFIDAIQLDYAVLALDGEIFREWARLMHGKSDALNTDAMIAATARVHGLTVVTRNTKDFKTFGVRVLNPFITHRGTRG